MAFSPRGADGIAAAAEPFRKHAFGTAVDVADASQVEAWAAAASERMGGIDIVAPNVSALAGGDDLAVGKAGRLHVELSVLSRKFYF